jgi:hypothetical protein
MGIRLEAVVAKVREEEAPGEATGERGSLGPPRVNGQHVYLVFMWVGREARVTSKGVDTGFVGSV